MRMAGPVSAPNASSATIETISAPQPHSRGFSSTVNSRPVLVTSARIVRVSSGTSDRTSTTVASMPSSADSSLGRRQRPRHHRGQREDRRVPALPQHAGPAEFVGDLAVRHLALARVQALVLEEV